MSTSRPTEDADLREPEKPSEDAATATVDATEPTTPELDSEAGATELSDEPESAPTLRSKLARWFPVELVVLTVLAAITRFVALYNPRAIAFDEIYFREFALHYKAGTYYYDLHPPLGKLLLGLWAAIAGVDGTALDKDPAVAIRLLPAFAGTLLIVVVYLFIRELSNSRRIATLGAALVMLDNLLLVESRFILIDSMLLLFGLGAVTLALAARKRTGRAYWLMFAGAAFLAGCAVATKLTGLSALGLVGVLWLVDVVRERKDWRNDWNKDWKRLIAQAALITLIPAFVYFASFGAHFALLTKSGPGDAYMSQTFQSTLKGNANYKPEAHLSLRQKFTELNATNHRYELSLNESSHPYQSKWLSWPVMKRGVYVYVGEAGNGKARYVYALGNPAVWWGTLLGVVIVLFGWLLRPKRVNPYKWPLAFLGLAYAVNFLPFAAIVRPMFLYHYLFALIFSISFMVIGIGALTGWIEDRPKPFSFASRKSAIGYWAILGVALATFLYFAPITYGIPLSPEGLESRMWLSSWR